MADPTLLRCNFRPLLPLCLTAKPLLQPGANLWNKQDWSLHPTCARTFTLAVVGNHLVTGEVFNPSFLPCFENNQRCICYSWTDSRLPIALLLVSRVLHPVKGTHFLCIMPGMGIPIWGSNHSIYVVSLFFWVCSKGHSSIPDCFF